MSKKALYLFIISFLLLVTVVALNRYSFQRMKRFTEWIDHTRDVINTFESLSNDFKSAQLYTPHYDTGSLHTLYHQYKTDADSIEGELAYLGGLVSDNKEQEKMVARIAGITHAQIGALMQNNTSELIQSGQEWRLRQVLIVHR